MTTAATIYGPGYTAPELRPDQLRATVAMPAAGNVQSEGMNQ